MASGVLFFELTGVVLVLQSSDQDTKSAPASHHDHVSPLNDRGQNGTHALSEARVSYTTQARGSSNPSPMVCSRASRAHACLSSAATRKLGCSCRVYLGTARNLERTLFRKKGRR
jgi:hypothetical protein